MADCLVALYVTKDQATTELGKKGIELVMALARKHKVPIFAPEFSSGLKEKNEDIEWVFVGADLKEFFFHI